MNFEARMRLPVAVCVAVFTAVQTTGAQERAIVTAADAAAAAPRIVARLFEGIAISDSTHDRAVVVVQEAFTRIGQILFFTEGDKCEKSLRADSINLSLDSTLVAMVRDTSSLALFRKRLDARRLIRPDVIRPGCKPPDASLVAWWVLQRMESPGKGAR